MMSELYGCAGQHLSFEDRKWIGEQQVLLGVNFLVPHLLLYTMAGERKRDFPCNMWYQQPWWPLNHVVDDYLARLCALMSQGTMAPELLVLHPQESLYPVRRPPAPEQGVWDVFRDADSARLTALDEGFQGLSHYLLAHQRQFDYGDETILADAGRVELEGGRPLLRIGEMRYPLVLLPNLTSIRASTLELLDQFAVAGGLILSVGETPTMVDGRDDASDRLGRFVRERVQRVGITGDAVRFAPMITGGASTDAPVRMSAPHGPDEVLEELDQALRRLTPPIVAVEARGPVRWLWQHTRRVGDSHVILLVNLSRQERVAGTLQLGNPLHGPLARPDLAQRTHTMLSEDTGVPAPLPFSLEPGESMVLIAGTANLSAFVPAPAPDAATHVHKVLSTWSGERLDDNAQTLDYAAFHRGDGQFGVPAPVIAIQQVLNDARHDGPLTLRYTFDSDLDPAESRAVRLVVEHPERCAIRVNGAPAAETDLPYWRDIRWRQIAVGHQLRRGENQIELHYPDFRHGDVNSVHDQVRRYGTEIESIYLVGDFAVTARPADDPRMVAPPDPTPAWTLRAVRGPFTLRRPQPLSPGDLVDQGYRSTPGAWSFAPRCVSIDARTNRYGWSWSGSACP
jgi:hypothetical protein